MAKNEKRCHFGIDISAEITKVFGRSADGWPMFRLVEVDVVDSDDEQLLLQTAQHVLSAAEMVTFQGFRFLHRKKEWLAGRLAVKEAVAGLLSCPSRDRRDFEIGLEPEGKPFLAGGQTDVHVAISHSGGKALGLASDAPCALDFQEVRDSLERVEARFASENETAILKSCQPDRLAGLGLLWAGKEALRKHVAIWPLLGFLEACLEKIDTRDGGFFLSFHPIVDKRDLPEKLPGVWASFYKNNALAVIFGEGNTN